MKLIIGSFIQEKNSFSTSKTDVQSFKEHEFLVGDEIILSNNKKGTEVGAFIKATEKVREKMLTGISVKR